MTARRRTRLVCGVGALGGRVAARWLAGGDRVLGITRARPEALAAAGIEPVVADLGADRPLPALPPVDTVFWGVGFGRADGTSSRGPRDVHVRGLARLLDHVTPSPNAPRPDGPPDGGPACRMEDVPSSQPEHNAEGLRPGARPVRIVLSSSTGVWGDQDGGLVDETTPAHPDRENGRILLEAEAVLAAHRIGPGVVLRFAGLYGPGRLPRLDDLRAGHPIPVDPDSWLNLVHLDDAARVVTAIADHPSPAGLYVVADGRPVLRREWYETLARCSGSPSPTWSPPSGSPHEDGRSVGSARRSDKRVDARRIWTALGLEPLHPRAVESIALLAGR
jgi:nucleoside-diphosphate-sugar epimerase